MINLTLEADANEGVVIEFGHVYLEELEKGTMMTPNADAVEQTIDLLEQLDVEFTVLVIVDDTSDRYRDEFGTPAFREYKNELVEKYVEELTPTPEAHFFESDFGTGIETVLSKVPHVDSDELGRPESWGRFHNPNKSATYVYGTNEKGESKPKVKVINRARDSAKSTRFTCQAYDMAMTLAKFGLVEGPENFPQRSNAITFYKQEFVGSPPFRDSAAVQRILYEQGVTPFQTFIPPRHLKIASDFSIEGVENFLEA